MFAPLIDPDQTPHQCARLTEAHLCHSLCSPTIACGRSVENEFSADSRDKSGLRIVAFEQKRVIQLYLAIDHIVQIEAVKDSKSEQERSIVTLTSGNRFICRRSAKDLAAAIGELSAGR